MLRASDFAMTGYGRSVWQIRPDRLPARWLWWRSVYLTYFWRDCCCVSHQVNTCPASIVHQALQPQPLQEEEAAGADDDDGNNMKDPSFENLQPHFFRVFMDSSVILLLISGGCCGHGSFGGRNWSITHRSVAVVEGWIRLYLWIEFLKKFN